MNNQCNKNRLEIQLEMLEKKYCNNGKNFVCRPHTLYLLYKKVQQNTTHLQIFIVIVQ